MFIDINLKLSENCPFSYEVRYRESIIKKGNTGGTVNGSPFEMR